MLKRSAIGASVAVLAVAGTVTYTVTSETTATRTAGSDRGRVHSRALEDLPGAASGGTGGKAKGLSRRTTEPFSMVGVTWDRPAEELRGTIRFRARDAGTGTWSGWKAIEPHSADAPEHGGRGGTSGLWTGPSDGIEITVAGAAALPVGLRVDLIDPGTAGATPRALGEGGMRLMAARDVTAPRPAIVPRATWGADETLVKEPPEYDTSVKAAFVHHTTSGNDYTCAESAAVVRSLFLYHVQGQGWNDIGYNFLVDKCGTLYEGRAGGADRPVHGAHTYGFNTDTTGIALLGTHTAANDPDLPGVAPTQASLNGAAKVAAWKLGLTGADPTARTTLTSAAPDGTGGKYPFGQEVEFGTIAGHRDGFATACPGEQLYAKLPAIRTAAKQITVPAIATEVTGATLAGGRYHTRSTATLKWSPAQGATYKAHVDGKAVATGTGSATVTLAPGTHTVQLHGSYADGTTSSSPAYTIVADTTRPTITGQALYLRRSTVSGTAIPVALHWKAADNAFLAAVKATSPAAKTFETTATSWAASAKPYTTQSWSLTAADAAGNTGTAAISRYAGVTNEQSATRTGTWKTTTTASYLGGRGLYSSAKGAGASWTFTGRTAGLIVKRGSGLGAVHVYVDGAKLGTLDTRASTTSYRQLIWTRSWSASGKHTIKIVVAGTSGRPTVGIDGLAYIR
ncbi:N-acetylmuramoyl-L-alanine amidase [Spirillospora albida]|uniref:N-acetylmuramoyl-L-alanine amidase n=1 Tax=Spirillospora albida TaxID=58123 RepID=UPI0004BEB71B|nr:N-acetylmuramoyl-L-alanine amidase [Spirillospora albida]